MNQKAFNRICTDKLKRNHPDDFKECVRLVTPLIEDLSLIPDIIKFVENQGYKRDNIDSAIFIGTVYALIAPYKLYYPNIRLSSGIRDLISNAMGYNNPEITNHYSKVLTSYAKGRWLAKMNGLAEGFLKSIQNNGN